MLAPLQAPAHPHEFVDTGLNFRFDAQGRLAAVGVVWLYDDLTSLLILEDLGMDQDGDGVLNAEESARLTGMAGQWPEGFDGNLLLSADGLPQRLSLPLEATAGLREGRIYMTHIRALEARIDPQGAAITLQAYDPGYYTFYDLKGMPGVIGREDCLVTVEPPDIAGAQRLYEEALAGMSDEELLEQGGFPEIGGAFADLLRLTCGAP